jgi:predicted amidohydrolase YtcJ
VLLAGRAELADTPFDPGITLGPFKIHLHEAHLPDFDATAAQVRAAHGRGRAVAVHCVTEAELVFALGFWRDAGARPGDRIEHASVTPEWALAEIAALGLAVAVQPHFVHERGDQYRETIPKEDWPDLYRLRSFQAYGIPLAGGSDAPFGGWDPWAAMSAAVSRRTLAGHLLNAEEALTPEAALALFLADPLELGCTRRIEAGAAADLCLLSAPWRVARDALSADLVCATFVGGRRIDDGVDQAQA